MGYFYYFFQDRKGVIGGEEASSFYFQKGNDVLIRLQKSVCGIRLFFRGQFTI